MQRRTSYFRDVGIAEGYCRICGSYGELTKDHVPPKALMPAGNSLYCSLFEGTIHKEVKRKKGRSGIYFKTLCKKCNGQTLGEIDDVYKNLKININNLYKFINRGGTLIEKQRVSCDSSKFLRATIGHLLAICDQESCKNPLKESSYFTPLREFVLGQREDLDDHEIRIWPFTTRKTIIIQTIASTVKISSKSHGGEIYSSIKVFPFGLSIRLRDKPAEILDFGDIVKPSMDHIIFSPWLKPHRNYPEGIFRNDQIIASNQAAGLYGTIEA